MAVTNNFAASTLDLNGQVALSQPTALVWGPDGRLYVTEVDGDVKVLTVAFGDKNPLDANNTAQFYVTASTTVNLIKGAVQNHNDDGAANTGANRQVTGIDVTQQYDASGAPVMIGGKPAVTMYVTSSDSRIGAGGGGNDTGLDTNSGVITMLTQTGPNTWTAIDLVRGLPRSEENHATNGLEVIQTFNPDGKLFSERIIVANGGNANTGAPSNNFAGQQEQPLSAAILEIDLTMLKGMPVLNDNGRAYVYDIPTLNDPSRADVGGADVNDPFGGNDGRNSAKLLADGPVSIYSPGYRNAYDVEVTDDGRVWTYDNGANNEWGGRPIGEAGDNGGAVDNAQAVGYIATNLNNGDGNANDDINLVAWNPSNLDNFHEVTRSDDLAGRLLSAGQGGATTFVGPDGLTYFYGGHPNPTRAEGSRAGLLFSPDAGTDNAYLLVSDTDSYGNGGDSDYDEVIAWLTTVENNNTAFPNNGVYGADPGELTQKVLAVTPGVLYDIYSFANGSGAAVVAGASPNLNPPAGGTFQGQAGLPSDIADIVAYKNPIEGDYKEGGKTDGALDSGFGSINGLAEYTSTILDAGGVKMSGAILATQLGGGNIIVMGRNADGTMSSIVSGGSAIAADRTVIAAGGGPLGIATVGDDFIERGLSQPFQGSIWTAVYNQNGPLIEIFQPNNGAVPLAGQEIVNPTDRDLDGVDYVADPFEFSATNGLAIAPGEKIVIDFSPLNTNFPTSLASTGLLGAALDGLTPNRDAQTATENFPADQQFDGLFNIGGNILPGGNAPILQIKKVVAGTVVGAANTARDVLHTGILPSADTDRIVATMLMKNWIPAEGGVALGQLTGMIFGDGTQANFVRFVFGSVNGAAGFEVGYEIGDANYAAIAQIAVPALTNAAISTLELRLTINKADGFAVTAEYRLEGQTAFTALDLNEFTLPTGVLQNVLTGAHTIGTGASQQTSGAAIGFLAETSAGNTLDAIDFDDLTIEAFGNEILADTAAGVGEAGSANVDTVIYTGTDTALAPLAADVENFDGSGSAASYTVTANALDNVIRVGTGANTVTTGAGTDVVRGTLAQLAGDTITDFSTDDTVLIEGANLNGLTVTYGAGSAQVIVNGQAITFSGPDFAEFNPADGPATFGLTQTDDGVEIALTPAETVLYRVNAGNTVTAIDGGIDWIGDNGLGATPTNGVARIGGKAATFSNAITDAENEVDYYNVDAAIVPWQVFVDERGQGIPNAAAVEYTFAVEVGVSYKIEYFYTENWNGIYSSPVPRVFDVQVEGVVPAAFEDIHPLRDATDFVDGAGSALPTTNTNAQAYNGVATKREFTYTATDDTLNIALVNNTQEAKVNAIQITRLGGSVTPPADTTPPQIVSISVNNPQSFVDGTRIATVVLTDETGFDAGDFVGLTGSELVFTGIVPQTVSAPSIALSNGGKTATLTYTLSRDDNSWPVGVGQIAIAPGAYGDAAGNDSPAAQAAFVLAPFLSALERGTVVRAINVGTTDLAPATNLGTDLVQGGTDNNRYGGAIAADSLIKDAAGNAIAFEADNNAWYTSPKTNGQLNANVDGQSGTTGSNSGGVDLDGSAYHTYRDSGADVWTATYTGFAPGAYIVELHFAELFQTAAGTRVGDFFINGKLVADDYDAFTAGGGADRPSFIRVPVTVVDGAITVTVDSSAGQAGYSAIVVYEAVDPNLPPTISVADAQAVEGGDAVITFTRIGDLSEAVTVTFTLTPGTAGAADYTAPAQTSVVIPANQGSASIAIPIIDDTAEEGAESFTVSILSVANTSNTAVIADASATVTIAASDTSIVTPVGATIFELDFETAGAPLAQGGFDGLLGGAGAADAAGNARIEDGKLKLTTSNGDLSQGGQTDSKNDFIEAVNLSDPTLQQVFLTTAFNNPFASGQPNYVQQGILIATGDPATQQNAEQFQKLIVGGNGGDAVQIWSQGLAGTDFAPKVADMSAAAVANGGAAFSFDTIARVELSMRFDKATDLTGVFVTFFDASGAVLGGVRPEATPGFLTLAPVPTPPAVVAAIDAGTSVVGVTSTDFDAPPAFEATWDFLRVSSPQYVAPVEGTDSVRGTVIGDFSDDRAAPTVLGALSLGDNVIVATQQGDNEPGGRDRDYFTFTVAEGQVLSQLVLQGFATDDTGLPQGFIGIQEGGAVTTNPTTFAGADALLGGLIYNDGLLNNDILPALGDGNEQGFTFIGFTAPLAAGTYTVWLNQGGIATTATLNFIVSKSAVPEISLSIADAPTLVEGGDTGDTTLLFGLTASDNFSGAVTVTYDAQGQTGLTQEVTFTDGKGVLSVDVANDDAANGDDVVSVTVTGGADGTNTFTLGAATATGTVTEDDAAAPALFRGGIVAAFNAGGPALTQDGIAFAAAEGGTTAPFSGGLFFADGGGGNGEQPVFDGTVYETEINGDTDGSFTFSATVEPGKQYFVDLYFAEIFQSNAGQRQFDVFVEGAAVPVLDNYDIIATTGGFNTPVIVQLADPIAPGENGAIDLSFVTVADRAKVSAIVIREAVPAGQVAIANAPTLAESGDTGDTTLLFPLTLSGPDATVTLDYTVNGAAQQAQVTFVNGAATLSIAVANDNTDNGTERVAVTLTGAGTGFSLGASASATGDVTEDDVFDPADIDGDGIANAIDPAAYDATNGAPGVAANTLAQGGRIEFNFDTPTSNVFDGSTGLTGVMTTVSVTPPPSATDPYGILTNEATTSITGDGFLSVDSSGTDTFTIGTASGFATQNAGQDLYQAVMDVTANDRVRFETKFKNPFDIEPTSFSSLGLQIGAGDQDNFVKFVFGGNNGTGNGASRFQIGNNNGLQTSPTNTANLVDQNLTLSSAVTLAGVPGLTDVNASGSINYQDLLQFTDSIKLALEVDRTTAPQMTLKGFWEFYDAAGNVIAAGIFPTNGSSLLIKNGSALEAALNGANPNFSGAGGVAFGVIHTDWDSSPLTDNDTFTAEFDYLRAISLDEAPNLPPTLDAGIVAQTAPEDALFSFAVPANAFADDGGAENLTLTATLADGAPLPTWLSFANGVFTGTPENGDVGVLSVKVLASDGVNPPAEALFDLTVANVNDAPGIAGTVAGQTFTAGTGGAVDLTAITVSDIDVNDVATLKARLASGDPLPAGLSLANGQLVAATTLAAGVYAVELYAEDQSQAESISTVALTITVDPAPNVPPTTAPIVAEPVAENAAPVVIDLLQGAQDSDGSILGVAGVTVTAGGEAVTFTLDGATLTIDPTQFAATLAAGESAVVSVAYTVTDGQGGETPNTATLTVDGLNGPFTFFVDGDGDGFGVDDAATNVSAYTAPAGTAAVAGDANDADATVFPGAPEINDGKDNNQNGQTDENNSAPVANADAVSAPQDGAVAIPVATLLGNDSDPDGDTLTLISVEDALNGTVSLDAGVVTFTPTAGFSGLASFTYTVSDGFGGTATATASVDVTATPNTAPEAGDAPEAQTATQDQPFTLDLPEGLFTDDGGPENLTLTATLANGDPLPAWLNFDAATGAFSGTPANGDVGALTVRVTATDAGQLSASVDFGITVTNVNDAPTLAGAPTGDQSGQVGAPFALTLPEGLFTDPDTPFGDALTLSASGLPAGVTFDPATGAFGGTPTAAGAFTVTVTATDIAGATASDSFTLTVAPGDPVDPTPVTVRLQAEDATLGGGYKVAAAATADGGQLIWIPNGQGLTGTATFNLGAKGVPPGVYTIKIGHFDENDGDSRIDVAVSGANPFSNFFIMSDDATSGNGAQSASFRVRVFEGVSVDADSVLTLSGLRDAGEYARIDYVEFIGVADDADDNLPPFVPFAIPDQTVSQNATLDLDVGGVFADPEEDALTFTLSGPDWLSIDDSGRLTGTPGAGDVTAGSVQVTVFASDGFNAPVPVSFNLTVTKVNTAPTTTGVANQILRVGEAASVSVSGAFSDADNDTLSYTLTGELPTGLIFNTETGVFTGQPTASGSFQVTVTASDGEAAVASSFVFNVLPEADARPTLRIEAETFDLASGGFFIENLAGGRQVIRLLNNKTGEATLDFTGSQATGAYDLRIAFFDENDGVSSAFLSVDADGDGTFVPLGNFLFDQDGGGNGSQLSNIRVLTFPGLVVGPNTVLKLVANSNAGEFARIDYVELAPVAGEVNFAPFVANGIDDVAQDTPAALAIDLNEINAFDDPEEDGLSYSIVSGPAWLSIVDGVLTGTPPGAGAYAVTVGATDGPDASGVTVQTGFTITVANDPSVNLPPSVSLTNLLAAIAENADTTARTKVADIVVTDDALGTATLALTGADAALFEIDGLELFLKAGVALDFETAASLAVSVTVDDPTVGAAPDATAPLTLAVTDANEGPTAVTLTPALTTIAEDASTAARIQVATIAADDDALGANIFTLSGADAALFEIDGPNLFLKAGAQLDFETNPVLDVTVTASDATAVDGAQASANLSIAVGDVTEVGIDPLAPNGDLDGDNIPNTSDTDVDGDGVANINDAFAYDAQNGMTLAAGETKFYGFDVEGTIWQNGMTGFLQGTTTTAGFNEDTGAATVSGGFLTVNPVTSGDTGGANNPQDDAQVGVKNGSFTATALIVNPWAGAATNPNSFDQLGLVLGLDSNDMIKLVFGQSGGVVEFQKQETTGATTTATKYGGANPVAGGNANVAFPTGVTLDTFAKAQITFAVASISPTSATVTGTIVFLNDSGAEIGRLDLPAAPIGGALAAALADPAAGVGVGFTHVDGGGAPGFIAQMDSLSITAAGGAPVNLAPTGVTLTNVVAEIAEATVTQTKVADIVVTDDGLGVNTLALTGADAALFEIVGTELFLKAGQTLDATANPTLDVAVIVDDASVGATPDATSAPLAIPVTETPVAGEQIVLRINAFGPQVASINGGPDWLADNGAGSIYLATTDNRGDAPAAGYTGSAAAIPAGVPESVLDTARSADVPFTYNIPVADIGGAGTFRVTLYVAELFAGGQATAFRIFDAALEGSVPTAFNNITPGTAFGADVGVLSAEVTVTDGVLNIGLLQDLVEGVQNPIVNAIEIVRLAGPAADTTAPTASIALTNPVDANAPLLVDVTLADASGINPATLGAADLQLLVAGVSVAATVTFTGFTGGVASYAIASPVGGWTNGLAVTVQVVAGQILDLATPANGNLLTAQSLTLTIGGGGVGGDQFGPTGDLDGDTIVNSADPDVDGDGALNAADPFAYDAQNGRLLTSGEVIELDFNTPGTPYQAGFTGLLQAGVAGSSALKPFTEDTDTATVSGGALNVTASVGDTGTVNTPEDDFQLGVKNRAFTVEARVLNPFDGPAANFQQLGVHVGIDSTDFVKFVFGFAAGAVEFSTRTNDVETKVSGGNIPLPAALGGLGGFEAVDIRLVVNATSATAATVQGFATFLDGAGQPIVGATNVSFGAATVTGALAAALFDESIGVGAGFTQTSLGGGGTFLAQLDAFKVTGGSGGSVTPPDPGNAAEAFAAQTDLDTSASYAAGVNGAAVLKIMEGNNSVAASNFGASSFQVENTGAKKISAIFIDVTSALYPDSVFDPDGLGGDTAFKAWAINSAGNTGGFITGSGYFLPGQAPIPNSGGSGGASNGGFKGAMVKFNPTVNGGFTFGEVVGFSGDMDPNSIAGMAKSGTTGVDTGATQGWDVGGISGHELIGSLFTVLFDDGTTASGQLMSDKSNAGSIARAAQGVTPEIVSLTVNGTGEGGLGVYGGATPTVIVTGDPGQLVRITMTRGLDPVTNPTNGIDGLVEARLARYDFKVSNAFDEQSVDVTIGANGTFDASALFNYGAASGTGKGGFVGDTTAPIGFAASAIGSIGGDVVPLGPVTAPIYLTNQGGPVTGGGGNPPTEGFFQIIGSGNAARFKVQIEDVNANGGTNPGGDWTYVPGDDPGLQVGTQGTGHYFWGSEVALTGLNNPEPDSFLNYTILIPEGQGGVFTFRARSSRDTNTPSDQRNDIWLRIDDDAEALQTTATNSVSSAGFVKVFGASTGWGFAGQIDSVAESDPNFPASFNLSAGLHTITLAGRSDGFHIDFWELYKGSAPSATASNSTFVATGPTAPTVVSPIADQQVEQAAGFSFTAPISTFADLDGDTLAISISAPTGFTVNGATVTAAPGLALGDYTIVVTATDDDQNAVSDTFVVSVVDNIVVTNFQAVVETAQDDIEVGSSVTSPDLETNKVVQLRFTVADGVANVTSVTSALVSWQSERAQSGTSTLTFQVENSQNAQPFGTGKSFIGGSEAVQITGAWADNAIINNVVDLADQINALIASQGPLDAGDTINVQVTGTGAVRYIQQATAVLDITAGGGGVTPPAPPTISIADVAAPVEEGSSAAFLVSLSGPATGPVTVSYNTVNGSAAAPGDFTAATNQTVTIPAGQTSATISVPTINDSLTEGQETFSVQIAATLAGATLTATKASATATIAASDQGGPVTPVPGTTTASILASSDDFETSGGAGSNDLEFGTQNGNPNTVGLRFTGLDLPDTADIESAYFIFKAEGSNAGAANLKIEIQNSTSAATYSAGSNPNARDYLPTSVEWNSVEAWQVNQTYQSPDVSALIESLIEQDGIDPQDTLGFRFTGTGLRQAYSFDSNGDAPQLVINYVDDFQF